MFWIITIGIILMFLGILFIIFRGSGIDRDGWLGTGIFFIAIGCVVIFIFGFAIYTVDTEDTFYPVSDLEITPTSTSIVIVCPDGHVKKIKYFRTSSKLDSITGVVHRGYINRFGGVWEHEYLLKWPNSIED